jgi:hypothetical protein
MVRIASLSAGLALAALTALSMTARPANAVVYCKSVGVPQGCVARPVAPVARRAVVTPGVGAPGVGVRPRHSHEPRWSGQSRRPALRAQPPPAAWPARHRPFESGMTHRLYHLEGAVRTSQRLEWPPRPAKPAVAITAHSWVLLLGAPASQSLLPCAAHQRA